MPWATRRVLLVNAANQANLTIGVVWSSTTSLPCGTKPAKSTSWTLEEGSLRNRQRTFKSSTKGSRYVLLFGKNIKIMNTVVQKLGRQNYFRSGKDRDIFYFYSHILFSFFLYTGDAIRSHWQQCLHLGLPISVHGCTSLCSGLGKRYSAIEVN